MCFTSEFRQVHHTVILCCLPFRWHIPCCHGNWCRVEKELTAVITDKQMIQEETACASLIKGSWCLVEQWINLLWWRNRTENIWHSLRKIKILIFCDATNGFSVKCSLRNDYRNSMLMTCHYQDLGGASDWLKQISLAPIIGTQTWVATHHQCEN